MADCAAVDTGATGKYIKQGCSPMLRIVFTTILPGFTDEFSLFVPLPLKSTFG